jgi:hypothetical protein
MKEPDHETFQKLYDFYFELLGRSMHAGQQPLVTHMSIATNMSLRIGAALNLRPQIGPLGMALAVSEKSPDIIKHAIGEERMEEIAKEKKGPMSIEKGRLQKIFESACYGLDRSVIFLIDEAKDVAAAHLVVGAKDILIYFAEVLELEIKKNHEEAKALSRRICKNRYRYVEYALERIETGGVITLEGD